MSVFLGSSLPRLMPPRLLLEFLLSLLLVVPLEDGREPLEDDVLDEGRDPVDEDVLEDGREPVEDDELEVGRWPVPCWLLEEEDPVEGRDALPLAPCASCCLFISFTVVCPENWVEDLETVDCCVSPVFTVTSISAVSETSAAPPERVRFLTISLRELARLDLC